MANHITLETVRELFDYNYWARDQQLAVCRDLSTEQLLQPLGGSFKNLRNTLVHLLVVEWLWLERYLGRTPHPIPKTVDFPTISFITDRWELEEKRMRKYLLTLKDGDLEKTLTCQSTRGETWSYPLWKMLVHLLNHQSFHRGQVTFCFRQLGLKPPKVDFMDHLSV